MNKTDYIIRQLARTSKKKYESYVVTRVWHLLNNLDIKFVTQQHVTTKSGRALTDIYFPQIQLHVEIDEGHHRNQTSKDEAREADIINATGHSFERIKAFDVGIEDINMKIDELVDLIREKFRSSNAARWDIEAEYNPQTYILKGMISVSDNVAFRTIADACNCFGRNYKGFQRAFAPHPIEDRMLWFPKLYENKHWNNSISLDEETIEEQKKSGHDEYHQNVIKDASQLKERLVFARVKGNLGDVLYRFKGVYKLDLDKSKEEHKEIYRRTEKFVKTYMYNSNNRVVACNDTGIMR